MVNSKRERLQLKGGCNKITVSTTARVQEKCAQKYVDVFVYDGFDDVCSETSGSKTTFTFNPNWRSVTIYFVKQENNILIKWIVSKQNLIH